MLSLRTKLRLRRAIKNAGNAVAGTLAVGLLKLLRLANPDTLANLGGWLARTIAPLFKENQIGRDNLTLAFPEKSPEEIERILRGVWDNLGRSGAEFASLTGYGITMSIIRKRKAVSNSGRSIPSVSTRCAMTASRR